MTGIPSMWSDFLAATQFEPLVASNARRRQRRMARHALRRVRFQLQCGRGVPGKGEYFLDQITYHGDPSELALLRRGTTRVLVHECGSLVHGAVEVPVHRIEAREPVAERSSDWSAGDIRTPAPWPAAEHGCCRTSHWPSTGLPSRCRSTAATCPSRSVVCPIWSMALDTSIRPTRAAAGIDRSGLFFV